ncbi:hypothetical protein BC940DRAFT_300945 [Gongronella butleri]|nr:hypothetical protein BC940DRAFT_300945 [Gongronella butleri]
MPSSRRGSPVARPTSMLVSSSSSMGKEAMVTRRDDPKPVQTNPFAYVSRASTLDEYLHASVMQRVDDLYDVPYIDEVQSTISEHSQYSALFSTLSSLSPSSISSIESHLDKLSLHANNSTSNSSNSHRTTMESTMMERHHVTHDNNAHHDVSAIPNTVDDLLAAAADNAELAYGLAVAHYHGSVDGTADVAKAAYWFDRAAALGTPSTAGLTSMAHYRAGQLLLAQSGAASATTTTTTMTKTQNPPPQPQQKQILEQRAWQHLEHAAAAGHARAALLVGSRAQASNDVGRAFTCFLAAWRHGCLQGETALAGLLMQMTDHDFTLLEIDPMALSHAAAANRDQLALYLLHQAAKQGDLLATLQLGALHTQAPHEDVEQALEWFDRAGVLIDGGHYEEEASSKVAMYHYLLGREYWLLFGRQAFDSSVRWTTEGKRRRHHHQLAVDHFTKASARGYAPAQRALGHLCYIDAHPDAQVRAQQQKKAHRLFLAAAAQGDVSSMGFLGEQYQHGHGTAQNTELAIHYYQQATQGGSAVAQLSLGTLFHEQGLYDHALPHFLALATRPPAASKQDVLEQDIFNITCHAKFMVASYRQVGHACTADPCAAFDAMRQLADNDHYAPAYLPVALAYQRGIVAPNVSKASNASNALKASKASMLSHSPPLSNSSQSSNSSKSSLIGPATPSPSPPPADAVMVLEANLPLAFSYFEKAATLDDSLDAQLALASMCANGYDFRALDGSVQRKGKDRTRAFHWYSLAAERHQHPEAQYCLGIYYAKGLAPLTDKDLDAAMQLYDASARQDYALAMVQLAPLLIAQNRVDDARQWLQRAVDKQLPSAYRELALLYERYYTSDPESHEKGWHLLTRAIELNDAQAWCVRSRYYEHGWHVPQDTEKALTCLTNALEKKYLKAALLIGEFQERHGGREHALETYNALIKRHPLRSQIGWYARLNKSRLLVHAMAAGPEHTPSANDSLDQVFRWLQDMADQQLGKDAIEPLYLLGVCYEFGIGTDGSLGRAKVAYEEACKLNVPDVSWPQQSARLRLAILCANQDQPREALAHIRCMEPHLQRMNHQSPETRLQARLARYYLGYFLLYGEKDETDIDGGLQWLQEAADQGEGKAWYALGEWAQQHDAPDEAKARFEKGVSMGHAGCMRELAMVLQQEHAGDVQWDGMDAFELLKRAHKLGDVEAAVKLGIAMQHGLGTATDVRGGDVMMALGLLRGAAQQGHKMAAMYTALAFQELGQQNLAVEWFQIHPDHLISRVWLAYYRLKGLGGVQPDARAAFAELLAIVDANASNTSATLTKADDETLSLALLMVGRCYEDGDGTTADAARAMVYYARAQQRTQDVEATFRLGKLLFNQGGDAGQLRAFECFDAAASKGHLEAKYMVGVYHARGLGGVRRDKQTAIIHLRRTVQAGHTRAHLDLGHVLWAARQWDDALSHFNKAADLHIPEAAFHLGHLYHTGKKLRNGTRIVPQDHNRAFAYFQKAADHGHAHAALMLGSYYQEGYDAAFHPVNLDKAAYYYQLALKTFESPDSGENIDDATRHAIAMLQLANAKLSHALAEQATDPLDANQHHQRAFDAFLSLSPLFRTNSSAVSSNDDLDDLEETQDDNENDNDDDDMPWYDAQLMVGFYYLHGWGPIEKNEHAAMRAIRDAARHGHADAMVALAKCYEEGLAVQKDQLAAYDHWLAAANLGAVDAMTRVSDYLRHGTAGQYDMDTADLWDAKASYHRERTFDDASSIYTTTSTSSTSSSI